jgi:hypothetical protein
MSAVNLVNVPIAAGATTSSAVPISNALPCGVYTDPNGTGTSITFLSATMANGTFSRVSDGNGGAYSKTFTPGDFVPIDFSQFAGCSFLKIVSGSTEAKALNMTLAALS